MKVLTVIGCGLIGGSLALSFKRKGLAEKIIACDIRQENLSDALAMGAADEVSTDIATAVKDADCIVVAVPVLAMENVFRSVAAAMKPQAIVTDVGSTRTSVIAMARRGLGDCFHRYAPAHPIAGGELPGVLHATDDLFEGKIVISTPDEGMDENVVSEVENLWEQIGATVQRMTPAEHDEIFASVSHLPHVLAYALVDMIAQESNARAKLSMAGAGFRDFTRIASSSPVMWRDICLTNQEAISKELRRYRLELDQLQVAIDNKDSEAIERCFHNAMINRRGLVFPGTKK